MVVVVMDNEANNVSLLIAELTQPLARHLLDPRCSSLGACLLRESGSTQPRRAPSQICRDGGLWLHTREQQAWSMSTCNYTSSGTSPHLEMARRSRQSISARDVSEL